MEEKTQQFIADALGVFMQYGIKSVTMDDMARHLGVSKKTIYGYVKDKNDLVRQTLLFQCKLEKDTIAGISEKNLSAIDEMFEIGKFVTSLLKGLHPAIHYDLEKYHAEAFREVQKAHESHIYTCMVANLKKGIKEGHYRKDLNADVIAKIYMRKIDVVFDPQIFPPSEIAFEDVYAILFRYHILGVASTKGANYLQKKLEAIKTNSL